jgi:hypothetical protein
LYPKKVVIIFSPPTTTTNNNNNNNIITQQDAKVQGKVMLSSCLGSLQSSTCLMYQEAKQKQWCHQNWFVPKQIMMIPTL